MWISEELILDGRSLERRGSQKIKIVDFAGGRAKSVLTVQSARRQGKVAGAVFSSLECHTISCGAGASIMPRLEPDVLPSFDSSNL